MAEVQGGADTNDSGDVVDRILADHRELERLFAVLRDGQEDRAARLRELADLLMAHAMAEEAEVYPTLKHDAPVPPEDVDHGYEEHAEGHEALAALQGIDDVSSREWEDALARLEETVTHHLHDEENDVLGPAREKVPEHTRFKLGKDFMRAREGWLRQEPGAPDKVRSLLADLRQGS